MVRGAQQTFKELIMIVSSFRISYKSFKDVFKIKPIADVHLGHPNCDTRALRDYIRSGDSKTYFFGLGDLLDSIVVTDPRYRKSADVSDSESIINDAVGKAEEILELIPKGHLLGLVRGNHEDTYIKRTGYDPIRELCRRFKIKDLGMSGLIRLAFRKHDQKYAGGGRIVIIRYHHGWGGGSRTQGADLTKYAKDALHWDADCFLFSHVHRRQSDRVPRMGLSGELLIAKPLLLGICGTFKKSYTKTPDASFEETRGYPPTEIGGLTLNIRPIRRWVEMWIDV